MMPLCTRATPWLMCGCALASVTPPWVAQRVWPMPRLACAPSATAAASISATRPVRRTRRTSPSATRAMPAESYPLYSSRLSPSIRTGTTSRSAIAPTMPHMYPLLPGCPPSVRERPVRPDSRSVRPDTGHAGFFFFDQQDSSWHADCVRPGTPSPIRDTSAQDQPLSRPRGRLPRAWLLGGGALLALAAAVAWVVGGWTSGASSFDASRLRIAQVTRGDLVRDLSADGRVITANSPTLYAIAGGTVSLKVVAGDVVEAGQELAVIDSPELRSRLVQEESTLASLEGEANRAVLDAQLTRSDAQKLLDQAQIDYTAAQRDVERYERAYAGGAV